MKTLLVVAGLDPTGGAGLLADARVAGELGVRVVGVATALTVQDTSGVRAANPVPAELVEEQLRALLGDVEVDAVKIGMVGTARTAEGIAAALAATRAPVVWDPVLMPSRGGVPLLEGDVAAAAAALLPEARVVTPNLDEAAALSGLVVADVHGMRRAAEEIVKRGAAAALVKGGHLGGGRAVDVLQDGEQVVELDGARIAAGPVHGTGCVLATALACGLAQGAPLVDAARAAKEYLGARLRATLPVGRGARCLV